MSSQTEEYGYKSGEYLTPYQTTVVYDTGSLFETSVAFLVSRAQPIPIDSNTDLAIIAAACEHPSPEVVLFGDKFSRDDVMTFINRGFQLVHIFSYGQRDDPAGCKYLDTADGIQVPFDNRVVPFYIDSLYDHVCLIEGLTAIHLMDYITCASFPKYNSMLNATINHTTGGHLIRALKFARQPLGVLLVQLCSSARGFDKIEQLITRGQTIHEVGEYCASEQLKRGVYVNIKFCPKNTEDTKTYVVYAVEGPNHVSDMVQLAQIHPSVTNSNANFVLFYELDAHIDEGTTYPGWFVTIVGVKDAPNATDVLKSLTGDFATGTQYGATAWVPTGAANRILPFVYP